LVGPAVVKSERCCGESGTLGVSRPDISTQVRFRKEEEIRKAETELRGVLTQAAGSDAGALSAAATQNLKILTSCPSCLQGLSRYGDDLQNGLLEADYIVVEMARKLLGENWMAEYVAKANNGGIERVLV
jgi:Fe-S oxidoreductase